MGSPDRKYSATGGAVAPRDQRVASRRSIATPEAEQSGRVEDSPELDPGCEEPGAVSDQGMRLAEFRRRPGFRYSRGTLWICLRTDRRTRLDLRFSRVWICDQGVKLYARLRDSYVVCRSVERESAGLARHCRCRRGFRHLTVDRPDGRRLAVRLTGRRTVVNQPDSVRGLPHIARRVRLTHPVAGAMMMMVIPAAHLVLVSLCKRDESR
jgi:hypothetical protein